MKHAQQQERMTTLIVLKSLYMCLYVLKVSVPHPNYNEILWLLVLPIHIVFVLSNRIFVSVKLFFFGKIYCMWNVFHHTVRLCSSRDKVSKFQIFGVFYKFSTFCFIFHWPHTSICCFIISSSVGNLTQACKLQIW